MGFKRIAKNTAFLYAPGLLNPLASLVLVAVLARVQGAAGLGEYSLALTIYFIAESLTQMGLNVPVTRAVAVREDLAARYLAVSSMIGFVTGTLALIAVNWGVEVMDYSPSVINATKVVMLAIYPSVITASCQAVFLAFQRAHYIAVMSVAENVVKVCIATTVIVHGGGIVSVFIVIVVLRYAACFVQLALFRSRIGRFEWRIDRGILKELLRVTPVFSANVIVGILSTRIDVILLSKLATMEQIGFYTAATRILDFFMTAPQAFRQAVYPAMCEIRGQSERALKELLHRSIKYAALVGVFGAVGLFSFADWLILLFLGGRFASSEIALRIIAVAAAPSTLLLVCASLLFATGNEKYDLLTNTGRACFFVVLCVALVSPYGYVGTSFALALTSFAALGLQQVFVQRHVFPADLTRHLWRPCIAGGGAVIAVHAVSGIPTVAKLMVVSAAYGFLLVCLGTFSKEEMKQAVGCVRAVSLRVVRTATPSESKTNA